MVVSLRPEQPPSPEEIYQALLRSLRRRKGFGILFIQCSPAEAQRLIHRVQEDLPQKEIAVLQLFESVDNLYDTIASRTDLDTLNILFIQGIERSLEEYIKPGYGGEGNYYNLDTVPKILSHLNQRRELFRDHFPNICFVFILPLFAIKYFIRRAPDFFDWGSGVFEFPTELAQLEHESQQLLLEGDYKKYCDLSYLERNQKILKIQELTRELDKDTNLKVKLLVEQGNLFTASNKYEDAIVSYDEALACQKVNYIAWHNRGYALDKLGRHQEAILSYNKAIKIKPDFYLAWQDRGDALIELGQDQEAITSYEKALFNAEFEILLNPKKSQIHTLHQLIDRLLRQFNLHDIDANYVLSEVYIRGYKSIKSGIAMKNMLAWIRASAYNVIREIARERYRTLHLEDLNSIDLDKLFYIEPALGVDVSFEIELIEKALQKLEPPDQDIIRLRFIQGLSLSEIAQRLAKDDTVIGQSTISRRIQRSLQRLRMVLDEMNGSLKS